MSRTVGLGFLHRTVLLIAGASALVASAEVVTSKHAERLTLIFPVDGTDLSASQLQDLSTAWKKVNESCSLEGLVVAIEASFPTEGPDGARELAKLRGKNVHDRLVQLGVAPRSVYEDTLTLEELARTRARVVRGLMVAPNAVWVEFACNPLN